MGFTQWVLGWESLHGMGGGETTKRGGEWENSHHSLSSWAETVLQGWKRGTGAVGTKLLAGEEVSPEGQLRIGTAKLKMKLSEPTHKEESTPWVLE